MKVLFNKILPALFFVFVFSDLSAQIEIGVKGGYGYGQYFFQARDNIYLEFVPLYNGGLVFQYLNEQKVGVQASLIYVQKGWIEKTPEGGKATYLMDFADLEVLSYLKFSKKKEHGLFLKFGPYIGYSFNNDFSYTGNIDSVQIDYDSLQAAYKKFDYGISVGLSYTMKIKSTSLQAELLFRQGMYNILERDPNGIFQSICQALFVNFVYTIPFSRKQKINTKAIKED